MRSPASWLAVFGVVVACTASQPSPPPESTRGLTPGDTVEIQLQTEGSEEFTLPLATGDAALLVVDQTQVDAVVDIFDPQGKPAFRFDNPAGTEAPERFCFVARSSGTYRVQVAPFVGAGTSSLRLERLRPATEQDHSCAAAAAALMEGDFPTAARQAEAGGEWVLAAVASQEWGLAEVRRGDHPEARRAYRRGLEWAERADAPRLRITLHNLLAEQWMDLGQYREATVALREALEGAAHDPYPDGEAVALNDLARIAEYQGLGHRATEYSRQALQVWQAAGSSRAAIAFHTLGSSYLLLERYEEAEGYLQDSLKLARDSGQTAIEASALVQLGWSAYRQGRGVEAIALLERALPLRQELGDLPNQVGILDRLGTVLLHMKHFPEAEARYREALALLQQATPNPRFEATIRVNLGCALQKSGRDPDGEAELRAADSLLATHPNPDSHAYRYFCQGQIERRRGALQAARQALEEALRIVDGVRLEARRSGTRHPALEVWQDYAEFYVALLVDLYRQSGDSEPLHRAFEAADERRVRSFYETLAEDTLSPQAGMEPALLTQHAALTERLRHLADTLLSASPAERPALEQQSRRLLLELAAVEDRARAAAGSRATVARPAPVHVDDVRALLPAGATLLSYSLGRERSFLFVLTRETLQVFDLPASAVLESLAQQAHEHLRHSQYPTSRNKARQALTALYPPLLAPVSPPAPAGETRQLLVIAEGALLYLPYAALPDGEGSQDPLLESTEVVHLPSAAVWQALAQRAARRTPAPFALAAIGDAAFSPWDDRVAAPSAAPRRSAPPGRPLDRLPHSGREVRAILELVPPAERLDALGFAATRDVLLDPQLSLYRRLHIATHAEIRDDIPELSEVILSLVNAHGELIPGRVRLLEIYSLHLPADLVVLSACSTALGKPLRGDGMLSFTRGFLTAGASRVLVSLWDVDDPATADLMIHFYEAHLGRGLPPAAALREAQQWVRRQPGWEAPYYWAGFVLQGAV